MSDNRSSSNGDSDDSLRRDPSIRRMTFAKSGMMFNLSNHALTLHRSQPQSQHEERRLSQPDGPDPGSGRRLKEQEKIFEIKASCDCDMASYKFDQIGAPARARPIKRVNFRSRI